MDYNYKPNPVYANKTDEELRSSVKYYDEFLQKLKLVRPVEKIVITSRWSIMIELWKRKIHKSRLQRGLATPEPESPEPESSEAESQEDDEDEISLSYEYDADIESEEGSEDPESLSNSTYWSDDLGLGNGTENKEAFWASAVFPRLSKINN